MKKEYVTPETSLVQTCAHGHILAVSVDFGDGNQAIIDGDPLVDSEWDPDAPGTWTTNQSFQSPAKKGFSDLKATNRFESLW